MTTDNIPNFERENHFCRVWIFDEECYTQIDGVGIEYPLGKTFISFYLWVIWEKLLEECIVESSLNVYKRYVDDIFVFFDSCSQLLTFVDYINQQHPNIKLTFESEKNNNFLFLLPKIWSKNNEFNTSVFKYSASSSVFTNFDCFIPISYKQRLINILIFWCFEICFSCEKLLSEIVYPKNDIFRRRRYSNDFVDNCINHCLIMLPKTVIKRLRQSSYW